jgi:chaperone required for assembly of F1-ATPase
MSAWEAKRFWTKVSVEPQGDGFKILLDGRTLSTPVKVPLIVPTNMLADKIAAEWDAQQSKIDPQTMPFTRTANAAIDKVAPQHTEVADLLVEYGETDLLCYRAESPDSLVILQNAAWDPLLAWAETRLNAHLKKMLGVIHSPQNIVSMQSLSRKVHDLDNFSLAAFHDLVSLSGSLIIGFAVLEQFMPVETLWNASRVDENWQIERWGEDEEAAVDIDIKRSAFFHAADFIEAIKI